MTIVDIARWTHVAQGAYSTFDPSRTDREALIEGGKGDFTFTQAARFLGIPTDPNDPLGPGLEVRHHQSNAPSGFSATVFFDRSSGKYVLGIRGTEEFADIAEDVSRIGFQGFAGDQLVSLYRYYRKLTTPGGQVVSYSDAEISTLQSIRLGVFVSPLSQVFTPARSAALRNELGQDRGLAPLSGGDPSVLPAGAPLVVAGHSLGGHLALLFGRFFPEVTEHVYTYNAPGISPYGEATLRAMGIAPSPASQVTNVDSMLGDELIARIWSKPGERIGVATEPGSPLYQHSIVPLTDALALYGAFGTLSPGLSGDAAAVSGIIAASSPFPEGSLEATLDRLGTLLNAGNAPVLVASSLADIDQREDYYQKLYRVLDSRESGRDYEIRSLVGKSASELAAMAATDVSVRFALVERLPFHAGNADYSSFAGSAFSGAWLASRAEMLSATIENNLIDRPFGRTASADSILFVDVDSGASFAMLSDEQYLFAQPLASAPERRGELQAFLGGTTYRRVVMFGSESASAGDHLLGRSDRDRLFGGAGDDRLEGGGGADYIEGGEGNDVLIGGDGADVLDGGVGLDRLEGGLGGDIYVFSAELDADTIVDHDGLVYAGGDQLTGGSGGAGGRYQSGDGRFRYAFTGDLHSGGTLIVNDALRIEEFRNGDLGIRLTAVPERREAVAPLAQTTLLGDTLYDPSLPGPGGTPIGRDDYGNYRPESRVGAAPDRQDRDDEFPGTPGNTHFVLGGGIDWAQDRLGGDDYLGLGAGDDAGFGGTGNDLLEGGDGRDLVAGGRGDDVLYAGSAATVDTDLDDAALPARADGGDLLSGGEGDDQLYGDAENNLIEGGAGADLIFAGAGDDWVGGDAMLLAGRERYGFFDPMPGRINTVVDVLWLDNPPPDFTLHRAVQAGRPATLSISGALISGPNEVEGSDDLIDAGAGNDTVWAGAGNDLVLGGSGDDVIADGAGSDVVYAGEGSDWLYVGLTGDDAIDVADGGAGDDTLIAAAGISAYLAGGAGRDSLSSRGGDVELHGGDGDDALTAEGGGLLDGGAGNDLIAVYNLEGGTTRVLWGRGDGRDLGGFFYGSVHLEMVDLLPAEVAVSRVEFEALGGLAPGVEFRLHGTADSFTVAGSSDIPEISELEVQFADGTVWDWGAIDQMLVESGGPPEAANFSGTAGNDVLYGTPGRDGLEGMGGHDWLVGGAGDDRYRYARGSGFVEIEDIDATPGNTDTLAFSGDIAPADVDVFAAGEDFILSVGDGGVRLHGGRTAAASIERIEFADATQWTPADLEARAEALPANRAPEVAASIGSVAVDPGSRVQITVPQGAVSDPDRFDALSVYAMTAEGDRLPGWLTFDAASMTFAASPSAGDAGTHEVLLVAADASGAAAVGSLTISVAGSGEVQVPGTPPAQAFSPPLAPAVDAPIGTESAPLLPREDADPVDALEARLAEPLPDVGVPADPLFRDMQRRFDVLLQTGRTNLGERYAEAIREFEERRLQREAPQDTAPPTDEEVEAWNAAMHSWHDRNPGFAEADLRGNDGVWTMGWGMSGPGERALGTPLSSDAAPGVANPPALARLSGAGAAPGLIEGLRQVR